MALKITLPANSPVLMNGGYQGTELYLRVAGLHYIKRNNTCVLPIEYYASETDAKAEPEGPQVFPIGLPRLIPIMNPSDVLDTRADTTRAVSYLTVKTYIETVGGEGTIVEPV